MLSDNILTWHPPNFGAQINTATHTAIRSRKLMLPAIDLSRWGAGNQQEVRQATRSHFGQASIHDRASWLLSNIAPKPVTGKLASVIIWQTRNIFPELKGTSPLRFAAKHDHQFSFLRSAAMTRTTWFGFSSVASVSMNSRVSGREPKIACKVKDMQAQQASPTSTCSCSFVIFLLFAWYAVTNLSFVSLSSERSTLSSW